MTIEHHSTCPWCGEYGVDFAESASPSDFCGHDPALVRERPLPASAQEVGFVEMQESMIRSLMPKLTYDEAKKIIGEAIILGRQMGDFMVEQQTQQAAGLETDMVRSTVACTMIACLPLNLRVNQSLSIVFDSEVARTVWDHYALVMEPQIDDTSKVICTLTAK